MEIKQINTDKFFFLTFENVFDKDELSYIWKESAFLCDEYKLLSADKTRSAWDNKIRPLKRNKGIFLNSCYNLIGSNYLRLYTKFLDRLKYEKENLVRKDYNMNLFFNTNTDYTLLSYYEDDDFYSPHHDESCWTYIFWLFKEPKCFEGGDLIFTDVDYQINIKNNMSVLFPSWAKHRVTKIKMKEQNSPCSGNGRFSYTTFFNMK